MARLRRSFVVLCRILTMIQRQNSVYVLLCTSTLLVLFIPFYLVYIQIDNSYTQNDVTVVGWESNKSRNALDYIFPNNMTTVINNNQICNASSPPYILLIVCSNLKNYSLRLAIRNTWAFAAYQKFNISVAFLFGLSEDEKLNAQIQSENDIFNDIIVENFLDTYNNLTLKTLMMLKWVKQKCNNTKFIMKTDDDTYVNLISLLNLVQFIPHHQIERLVLGQLLCAAKPIADPSHKWYMPRYMYSSKIYPNYLSGVGYLMSTNAAIRLYNEAFSVPLLHMEDVFITGICSSIAGIKPMGHKYFDYMDPGYTECSSKQLSLICHSHRLSSHQMYETHYIFMNCDLPENRLVNINSDNKFLQKKYKDGFTGCLHTNPTFRFIRQS